MVYAVIGISFLIGFSLGFFLNRRKEVSGMLKIDKTDPARDKYLFEVDKLDGLDKKEFIVLKIESQK